MLATGNGTTATHDYVPDPGSSNGSCNICGERHSDEPNEAELATWRKRVVDPGAATELSEADIEACRASRLKQEEFRRNDRVSVRK